MNDKRILLLPALLGMYLLPLGVQATDRYVSATAGNDDNPGTLARPYATIQRAVNAAEPGDVVYVRAGTYKGPCGNCPVAYLQRSGTPNAWITFKNYPGEQPLVQFAGYAGFQLKAGTAYVEINGFRIQGAAGSQTLAQAQQQPNACKPGGGNYPGPINYDFNGAGITTDGNPDGGLAAPVSAPRSHHLRFVNNEILECSGGGIGVVQCDYITIENNLIYNTSWRTIYGTSGISLYQSWNFDQAPGYHNVIRGNRCFGNRVFVPVFWYCAITDGNGIIIDDSKNTQNSSVLGKYSGRTLVANNLCVNNGGSGIHAYSSEHVDMLNNTAYLNGQTPENTTGGEIFANASADVLMQNNILVGVPGKVLNYELECTNIRYANNLYFGGNGTAILGTAPVRADPLFVNPSFNFTTADFRLQAGSPAIGAGLATSAPATDLAGAARPGSRGFSLGAYEFSSVAAPLPVSLVSFTAERQGAGARLRWATASETDNAGFGIEASADGQGFRRVGWVAGRGTTAQPMAYEFTDPDLARNAGPTVYYRLAQTDLNGGLSYSPVRAVAADPTASSALTLAPNPAGSGEVRVAGAAPEAALLVLNAQGREVLRARADASGAAQLQLPATLPPGLYVVRAAGRAAKLLRE